MWKGNVLYSNLTSNENFWNFFNQLFTQCQKVPKGMISTVTSPSLQRPKRRQWVLPSCSLPCQLKIHQLIVFPVTLTDAPASPKWKKIPSPKATPPVGWRAPPARRIPFSDPTRTQIYGKWRRFSLTRIDWQSHCAELEAPDSRDDNVMDSWCSVPCLAWLLQLQQSVPPAHGRACAGQSWDPSWLQNADRDRQLAPG